MKDLGKHRKMIDSIDKRIVALLQQRAENVKKIADVKNRAGQEVYDAAREAEVLRNLKKAKKGKFSAQAIASIFNEVFSASRMLQRGIRVAYMGPVASYSHLAAVKRFGKSTDYMAVASIKDVFDEVEKTNADYGCVPIENSTEGAVNYTFDMFADSDLKIYSEVILDIRHNLISKAKGLKEIKRVYVHPQTRAQCRGWLEANLPEAELVEVSSNSMSAALAAKDKKSAGIGGELAAQVYGLKILASNIQDLADNVTRFFVIGRESPRRTGDDKTSIMVSIKDKVGALYHLLKPFQTNGVNLTNIESRPSRKKAWDYFFFVDFEGHRDDPKVKKTLGQIEKACGAVKILGSYPKF